MRTSTFNFIIEYFYPEIGGLEKSTERLALEFVRLGFFVNIITRAIDGLPTDEFYQGIHIIRIMGENYIEEAGKQGLFNNVVVNCVFGVGHNTKKNIWKPIFNTGIPAFIKIGTSNDMIGKGFSPQSFGGFEAILCQNDALLEETLQLKQPGLFGKRISNGMDIIGWRANQKSKFEARKILDIDMNSFVISAVGRFVQRKNFPLIINAVTKFVQMYGFENCVLLVHGSDFGQHDGEESKIRALICSNINLLRIEHLTPDSLVSDTLAASDVFITMGEAEGAPNIIIEAMATGLPIIASDISGHHVYVTNNGYLVDFSIDSICEMLYELYNNVDKRVSMAKASMNNAEEFDISVTAQGYLSIFTKGFEKS